MTKNDRERGAIALLAMLRIAARLSIAAAPLGLGAATSAWAAASLPAPGTYVLQRIQRVPEARLLDANDQPAPLSSLARGAVTALGFFYGQCVDPAGCPVAWSTFETVRREAAADDLLKTRLRLVFISLDPARDTPTVMRLFQDAENAGESSIPWAFLTSRGYDDLAPLLQAMGQDIAPDVDAAGRRTGAINHLLKVFLVDPDGWVREIYTTAFLTPESLLNDARSLALAHCDASNRR